MLPFPLVTTLSSPFLEINYRLSATCPGVPPTPSLSLPRSSRSFLPLPLRSAHSPPALVTVFTEAWHGLHSTACSIRGTLISTSPSCLLLPLVNCPPFTALIILPPFVIPISIFVHFRRYGVRSSRPVSHDRVFFQFLLCGFSVFRDRVCGDF